ncbi:GNAT family N-acetyltransferase [Nannocystis sp. SCPEA4]|uniref:GNAT family N-acetyltransferase n=1 Tax=Nannocystis sp. SCPEA4 TaxID=2996787 RepID=UPI00226EA714|nr:GNAT family N-acetyltransferase [Nannocystis sp. SCPEA4]MCY1059148.1 GNAT family N-acetyltransferase [Nannocystis sp. SCPEA4]
MTSHEGMSREGAEVRARLTAQLAAGGLRLTGSAPPVELIRLDETDAEAQFRLIDANRAHLREWLGWLDATDSAADVREFIAESRRQFHDDGTIAWSIRHDGEPVGVISFHAIAWDELRASLGFWLARPAMGRGIATSALRAVVAFGFGELGLRCLRARIAPGNTRSAALVRRLGFRSVGIIDPGEWLYGRSVAHEVFELEDMS